VKRRATGGAEITTPCVPRSVTAAHRDRDRARHGTGVTSHESGEAGRWPERADPGPAGVRRGATTGSRGQRVYARPGEWLIAGVAFAPCHGDAVEAGTTRLPPRPRRTVDRLDGGNVPRAVAFAGEEAIPRRGRGRAAASRPGPPPGAGRATRSPPPGPPPTRRPPGRGRTLASTITSKRAGG